MTQHVAGELLTVASSNAQASHHHSQRWEAVCKIDVIAIEDGQAVGDCGQRRKLGYQQAGDGDLYPSSRCESLC